MIDLFVLFLDKFAKEYTKQKNLGNILANPLFLKEVD